MKSKTTIKLPLTAVEKANLRKRKIKMANILDFAADELEVLLNATPARSKEILFNAGVQIKDNVCFITFVQPQGK